MPRVVDFTPVNSPALQPEASYSFLSSAGLVAMAATAIASSPSSSALAKTSAVSTESWQRDLKTLFDHAKERFPDVVWELTSDYDTGAQEDVWGHKGVCFCSVLIRTSRH